MKFLIFLLYCVVDSGEYLQNAATFFLLVWRENWSLPAFAGQNGEYVHESCRVKVKLFDHVDCGLPLINGTKSHTKKHASDVTEGPTDRKLNKARRTRGKGHS